MSEPEAPRTHDQGESTTAGRGQPRGPHPEAEPSLLRQALTAPNLLSILRLAGVPVFLWLLLGPHEDGWAFGLLVFSALTDWLDGKLARWLDQMSRLGQLLDPAADRLYIFATLLAFVLRDIIPWWVAAALVARELVVGVCLVALRRYQFTALDVTYIGKAATFVLMYAFPCLLLMQGSSEFAHVARPVAYAFTVWGCALYLWSGVLYVIQTTRAIARQSRGASTTS